MQIHRLTKTTKNPRLMMFAVLAPLSSLLLLNIAAGWASAKEAKLAAAGDGPGIQATRMLNGDERGIIQRVYNARKTKLKFKHTYYIKLFVQGGTAKGIISTTGKKDGDDDACNEDETAYDEELDHLVRKLSGDHFVKSYGFIVAPAHSVCYQHFHIDYYNTTEHYFIPLVDLTPKNAPQYIPNYSGNVDETEWFGLEFEVMDNAGLLGLTVAQTLCHAFTVLHMAPGTIHRGIPNGENHERPMFFIEIDNQVKMGDEVDFNEDDYFDGQTSLVQ